MNPLNILVVATAFILDAIFGDPEKWPHPVRYIGKIIESGEKLLWPQAKTNVSRLLAGGLLTFLTILITLATVIMALEIASWLSVWLYYIVLLYLIFAGICLHDLKRQTWRVEKSLRQGDLEMARYWLSRVVGRDTKCLSEQEIRRALVETLAENFSDGLVAPLFYLAIFGPLGLWGYKAINTLDSMIAYRNERYEYFGKVAAKLDDVANYIPSRLAGYLIIAAAWLAKADYRQAWIVFKHDARKHKSPNSGYPEAAMAGALNVFLGGTNTYGNVVVVKPYIGGQGGEPTSETVIFAQKIVTYASLMMMGPVSLLYALLY